MHKLRGIVGVASGAKAEYNFAFLTIGQFKGYLNGGTGIEDRLLLCRRDGVCFKAMWIFKTTVSADKFATVTGDGAIIIVHIKKGDAVGKFGIVRIASKERCHSSGRVR